MRYAVLPTGRIERAAGSRLAWLASLGAYITSRYIDAIAYARAVASR